MNEKYSLQYLIESLSQTTGESKKVAEQFSKAFFDTIVEALYMGETSIKIKGLGTFKLVEVDSRESVNVSNGERIVIPSYKKVSFVPDEEIAERLTQKKKQAEEAQPADNEEDAEVESQEVVAENVAETVTEEVAKVVEEVVAETPAAVAVVEAEEDNAIDELIAPEEMRRVEQPSSALDGIDLLISTPESLDELKSQYEEAKQKAEAAIAAAKQANTEKMRLERMLERLQAHTQPEAIEEVVEPEQPEVIEEAVEPEPELEPYEPEIKEEVEKEEEETVKEEVEEEAKKEVAPVQNVIMVNSHDDEDADDDTDDDDEGEEHLPWIKRHKWLAAAICVLVCGGILFAINALHNADMKVTVAEVVDDTPASRNKTYAKAIADSIRRQNQLDLQAVAPVQTDTTVAQKKSEPAKDERAVPPHCLMKKGESLTILSVRYYGTKDSVPAIIRVNQFRDPNNVPIGAKVFLP